MTRLLLIEPDRLLAQTYRRALAQAGYQVARRSTAQTAVTSLDAGLPELIILELQLADHNGVEFLYELRSYPEWDGVPVVLHTLVPPGHPGLGRQFWPQLGIIDYLYKPQTSLVQLVQRVDRLLVRPAVGA